MHIYTWYGIKRLPHHINYLIIIPKIDTWSTNNMVAKLIALSALLVFTASAIPTKTLSEPLAPLNNPSLPPATEVAHMMADRAVCDKVGPAVVQINMLLGAAIHAEDGSWGNLQRYTFFEDDKKEQKFQLYRSMTFSKTGDIRANVGQA